MAREAEYAREVRAELAEMFPGVRVLDTNQVIKYTGRTRKWVKAHIPLDNGFISVVKFCNLLG